MSNIPQDPPIAVRFHSLPQAASCGCVPAQKSQARTHGTPKGQRAAGRTCDKGSSHDKQLTVKLWTRPNSQGSQILNGRGPGGAGGHGHVRGFVWPTGGKLQARLGPGFHKAGQRVCGEQGTTGGLPLAPGTCWEVSLPLAAPMEEGTGGITGTQAQMEISSSVSEAGFDSAPCTVGTAVSYQSPAGWPQAPSVTVLTGCPGSEAGVPPRGSPDCSEMPCLPALRGSAG